MDHILGQGILGLPSANGLILYGVCVCVWLEFLRLYLTELITLDFNISTVADTPESLSFWGISVLEFQIPFRDKSALWSSIDIYGEKNRQLLR